MNISPSSWYLGNIGLTAADFNEDGWPDFAATIPNIIVADWAVYARDMDAADFDADGDYDFIIFDYPHGADGNFELRLYENVNPNSWSFTPRQLVNPQGQLIKTPHSVNMIVAGDFGGSGGPGTQRDGWPDIIVGQDDDGDQGKRGYTSTDQVAPKTTSMDHSKPMI